jgi:hypothetical protein
MPISTTLGVAEGRTKPATSCAPQQIPDKAAPPPDVLAPPQPLVSTNYRQRMVNDHCRPANALDRSLICKARQPRHHSPPANSKVPFPVIETTTAAVEMKKGRPIEPAHINRPQHSPNLLIKIKLLTIGTPINSGPVLVRESPAPT